MCSIYFLQRAARKAIVQTVLTRIAIAVPIIGERHSIVINWTEIRACIEYTLPTNKR